jgi:hypothetical protein
MGSITSKQWFQIISGVISGLITGAALFQTLFGQDTTIKIVAMLGIANIVLSSVGTVLSGPDSQTTQVKNVLAMGGVERIDVNAKATPELAAMATDPSLVKIGPASPDVRPTLVASAKSA